jgi:N-formylglutamate amidohydrolase
LRNLGYIVQRNKPYAGGFITEHYGDPANECHAMQIEVNRALYMDERNLCRGDRFDRVAEDLTKVIGTLACAAWTRRDGQRAAAE